MSLKLLSWNIEGRLTRFSKDGRGSPEHILEEIRRHDADIIVLAEASDGDAIDATTTATLQDMGYTIHSTDYDDSGIRQYAAVLDPTMKLLSRIPMQNITTIRYGGIRNMLYGDIQDPASGQSIRVFGIHLDDRRESLRLKQVKALCREVARSPLPVLLAGDFNAMHSTQWSARLLRSPVVSVPTSLLPNTLLRSLLERVADMARGTVLLQLESVSGLHEVDSAHRATTTLKLRGFDAFPSIRLIAIDHIYIGDAIESTNFSISRDGGSDHRALSVTLAVKG